MNDARSCTTAAASQDLLAMSLAFVFDCTSCKRDARPCDADDNAPAPSIRPSVHAGCANLAARAFKGTILGHVAWTAAAALKRQ